MPPINYGQGGANALGDMLVHPGTYAIRQSTLRSLVADLGGQLAQNGFKWIFVMNGHGAPTHNIAINEACDFVSETFRVTMLHVTGLFEPMRRFNPAERRSTPSSSRPRSSPPLGWMFMPVSAKHRACSRYDRISVRPNYKTLPSRAGRSLEELRAIATAPGWQGYLSTPAKATAQHGRALAAWWIDGSTDLILRAVRGENMFVHARIPETVAPAVAPILEKAIASETAFEAKLEDWLLQRKKRD